MTDRKPTHGCWTNGLLATFATIAIALCLVAITLIPLVGVAMWALERMKP